MNRPNPGQPPAVPSVPPAREGWITQERSYELITPLFGGGVEPGVADPVTVVRGTEVRGQLRFWWRACRGARYGGSLTEMKAAEDLLWGAASTKKNPRPSRVQIAVEVLKKGQRFVARDRQDKPVVNIGAPRSVWSYGAFPLNDKPDAYVTEGIAFVLTITYRQEDAADVAAALWAWETFGGVGGRTRRGFGALYCKSVNDVPNTDLPPADAAGAERWIRAKLQAHVARSAAGASKWPSDLPHLDPNMKLRLTAPRAALDVWSDLLDRLKNFRQQRPTTYEGGKPHVGRNRWPEPDALRGKFGASLRHKDRISEINKFPRAAFGLPISFEFKRDDQSAGDPRGKNTLVGRDGKKEYERLASPLILRPLACGDSKAIGLALLLEGTRLPPQLVFSDSKNLMVDAKLSVQEAAQIMSKDDRTPLLGNETNVLLAFLDTLK